MLVLAQSKSEPHLRLLSKQITSACANQRPHGMGNLGVKLWNLGEIPSQTISVDLLARCSSFQLSLQALRATFRLYFSDKKAVARLGNGEDLGMVGPSTAWRKHRLMPWHHPCPVSGIRLQQIDTLFPKEQLSEAWSRRNHGKIVWQSLWALWALAAI